MTIHSFSTRLARPLLLSAALLMQHLPATAHDVSPLELVRDTSSRMLVALKDEGAAIAADPGVLDRLVEKIVLPYFDFRRMSQWVLGKYWRGASDVQRERFVAEFRTLLVRSYGRALSDYAGEKVVYLPVNKDPAADRVTVRTEIRLHDDSSLAVAYSMYLDTDGWKVYDVAFSGVSMVTNYRSSYARIIRAQGMDSLIEIMEQRNREAKGG